MSEMPRRISNRPARAEASGLSTREDFGCCWSKKKSAAARTTNSGGDTYQAECFPENDDRGILHKLAGSGEQDIAQENMRGRDGPDEVVSFEYRHFRVLNARRPHSKDTESIVKARAVNQRSGLDSGFLGFLPGG
jgi:hypothetical protein